MTMSPTITLLDVLGFIASQADRDDTDRILVGVQARTKVLGSIDAAAVTVGADITTARLQPKYLTGLTGTVKSIDGKYASILLTEDSTDRLRYTRQQRFDVPSDEKQHLVRGIPLECCEVNG